MFKKFPDADIRASIVWIPILENDSLEAALPSVTFLSEKRIHHFYDSNQAVGKSIANSVGWAGHIAWDIYLFYPSGAKWGDAVPKPLHWMHQLKDTWATKKTYRTGIDLQHELFVSMEHLVMK